jgi:hypothetical protein
MAKVKYEKLVVVIDPPTNRLIIDMTDEELRVFKVMCGRNRSTAEFIFPSPHGTESAHVLANLLGELY